MVVDLLGNQEGKVLVRLWEGLVAKLRGGVSCQVSVPLRGRLYSVRELFEVNPDRRRCRKDVDRGCIFIHIYRLVRPAMIKSLSVSSESSLPALEDDTDSVCSDELLGSQSRRWLSDIMTGDMSLDKAEVSTVGWDGLFVDRHFPVGELEMLPAVKWKRPKVTKKKL